MPTIRLLLGFALLTAAITASKSWAQAAVITYTLPQAIPVLGNSLLLLLGLALAALGAFWIARKPARSRVFSAAFLAAGLALATSSSLWLSSNAQAVAMATTVLFSQNASPVQVSSFPAELENDLAEPATLRSIEITGCSTAAQLTGTCSPGLTLAAQGGRCLIENVCAAESGPTPEVCFSSSDFSTGDPWVICDANADEAWVSANTGATYDALAICQQLGYDNVGQSGGTCGNVCGYCQGSDTTSCENPGIRTFDGGGGSVTALTFTVHWTCVNE